MYVLSHNMYYNADSNHLQDNVLCVPDEQFELAVEAFTSRSDVLKPCDPSRLRRPDLLNHKYPRFKALGRTDFWLLVPASYCHITCEPGNIEWSLGRFILKQYCYFKRKSSDLLL